MAAMAVSVVDVTATAFAVNVFRTDRSGEGLDDRGGKDSATKRRLVPEYRMLESSNRDAC
eukprot:3911246-Rhodomonas_salina.8